MNKEAKIQISGVLPIVAFQILEIARQILFYLSSTDSDQEGDVQKFTKILGFITIGICLAFLILLGIIYYKYPLQLVLNKALSIIHYVNISLSSIFIYLFSQSDDSQTYIQNLHLEVIKIVILFQCLRITKGTNDVHRQIHKILNYCFIIFALTIHREYIDTLYKICSAIYIGCYCFNEGLQCLKRYYKSKELDSTNKIPSILTPNNIDYENVLLNKSKNIQSVNQSVNYCIVENGVVNKSNSDQLKPILESNIQQYNHGIQNINEIFDKSTSQTPICNQSTIEEKLSNQRTRNNSSVLWPVKTKEYQKDQILPFEKEITKDKESFTKKRKRMLQKKSQFSKQKNKLTKIETSVFEDLKKIIHINNNEQNSPVIMILENINLGLLCYDIDSRSVSYINKQIKEMFNEQDNKEIFNMMSTFRNYLQQTPQETTHQQTSRNLDLIPNDLFPQELKDLQTQSFRQKSQTEVAFQNSKGMSSSSNIQSLLSSFIDQGEIYDGFQVSSKGNIPQFQFSNLSKNSENEGSSSKKTIYSSQYLLKQQINELIYSIQNNVISQSQLCGLKIKFMTAPKNLSFGKNQRQSFQSYSRIFSMNSTAQQQQQQQQKEKIIQITLTPIFISNQRQILFIVEDVTHFNQIKVLESLNKNKSLMLSQVSHEIRNPISCIIAMLEEIQSITKEEQKLIYDCSQSALQSSKLLLNLLNDLLDMSQIKAGKFKLVLEQFNLCDILNEVQQMMQPLAKNKQDQIIVQVDETLQNKIYNIKSDKYRIRQILINLISNSIKYTQNGNIYIVLTREKLDDRYFRIAVRDEGQGIKKEFRQKLFQAFGQADDMESKTKNNPQGVGLGLMISNTIAKNLKPQAGQGPTSSLNHNTNTQKINSSLPQIRSQLTPTVMTSQSNRSLGQKWDQKESRYTSTIMVTQPSQFSFEEGLMINDEVEKGTEFYFVVYNFQSADLKQICSDTQNSRNLSINLQMKRPSLFSQIENVSQFDQSPVITKDNTNPLQGRQISVTGHLLLNVKKKSLDAFDSEVNSSEEESQSCSSSESYTNIDKSKNSIKGIETSKKNLNSNKEIISPTKDHQYKVNLETIDGKRLSERQIALKNQFYAANSHLKRKMINNRKSMNQDMENIIRRNSMRKKQYYAFADTEIHILIVDDDQFSALAIRSKITSAFKLFNRNLAIAFTTFYSGAECIKELMKRDKYYSFLFIDAQMPDLDGFESIRQIDSLNLRNNQYRTSDFQEAPIFKQLQVVLCSGFQKEEAKLYIYRIKHYLQKPIEQSELITVIRQIFIECSLDLPSDEEKNSDRNMNYHK